MNKSLLVAYLSIVIGAITLAIGVYILSQTPATTEALPAQTESEPYVVIPETAGAEPAENTDPSIPLAPAAPGSESWCEKMMDSADSEWSDSDAKTFARQCLYD